MTTATKRLTLAQYLTDDGDGDNRYELVNGELVEMPPESDLNNLIAIYLIGVLSQVGPIQRLRRGTEIVVSGFRSTVRVPDLMVLSEELGEALAGTSRSTIMPDMPPPALVVEIVSPGKENEERDYRYKRYGHLTVANQVRHPCPSEYAARGIVEYWIVDPIRTQVVVLELVAGLYEEAVYQGQERLLSPLFAELMISAEQVLTAL